MTSRKNVLLHSFENLPCFYLNDKAYQLDYFNEDDLDAVAELENNAGPDPWSKKNFLSSIRSSHKCILLRCNKELVAQAVLSFSAGEAEILIFSVDHKQQGMGIGRHFLENLLTLCKLMADQVFLEVRESNEVAIRLYDSIGFNQIGERVNYYPSSSQRITDKSNSKKLNGVRENALIFAKYL